MKKIALLTGATSGIGKETAKALARQNIDLILPVRDISKGDKVKDWIREVNPNAVIDIYKCDLASFSSIRAFALLVAEHYSHIDILINNAGAYFATYGETEDGYERQWQVNYLSHFMLTNMLIDLVKKSPRGRIINVASHSHFNSEINFSNPTLKGEYNGLKAYGQSKLANVIFTKLLAKRLKGTSVTANALHPGTFIKTGLIKRDVGFLYRFLFFITKPIRPNPKSGSETTIYLATSLETENTSGAYYDKKKMVKADPLSEDGQVQSKLWDLSLKATRQAMIIG